MLVENQLLEFTATPSFCNNWPEISVEANGVLLWQGTVDHQQRIQLPMQFLENNQVYIRYLNKRKGPTIWDTEISSDGQVIRDQNCVITDISIGRSRCDFLIYQLEFYSLDGGKTKSYGFMSQQGYFLLEFPGDVYNWVLANRTQSTMDKDEKRKSSLDYYNNYVIDKDNGDSAILAEIKELLAK